MDALVNELMKELNCDTVFTIPVLGGIPVKESVVVTWIIMAVILVLLYSVNQKFKRRKSKSWTDHTGNNRKRRTQFLQGHTGRTWSGIYTVSYDSDPLHRYCQSYRTAWF